MEAHPQAAPAGPRARREEQRNALAVQWRQLTRAATFVALLTSPAFFAILYQRNGWGFLAALVVTFIAVIAFRGLVDVVARKVIPSPSLYGADQRMADEDVIAKRRLWYWRTKYRHLTWLLVFGGIVVGVIFFIQWLHGDPVSLSAAFKSMGHWFAVLGPTLLVLGLQLPLLFFINLLILFGPLLFFGIQQVKGYEPGDADWGVKLEDVRGQAEAKAEVGRIISLWQSGEDFEQAGGKRERGLLFLGAPGTGKTMLAKAIATNFNSPFVTIPGSGFAQTFIGMDVILVRFLVRKAKKLARKWGGQCIIFIDEIDAVGMRRNALGGVPSRTSRASIYDTEFYGPMGSFHPDGELLLETPAWRERLFAARAEAAKSATLPPLFPRLQNFMFPGGMGMGGGMALNQLLVVMDGVDDPPWRKRFMTNRVNTFLDATYIIPQKIGSASLRLRRPKPRTEQVFFVGATNVPLEVLDPALIRPGRMGRHIWFRTPTKEDRKDIFQLYITKVAHEAELNSPKRRDEMARMTHGYSPAMIEQVCSMALTYAHSDGRLEFDWGDLVEAMTTVESGTAVGVTYHVDDARATAIHEAGHAIASHVFREDVLSTRLSIRMRGSSLGHHQAAEKEERFGAWRDKEIGELIWILGAMAAEQVFYGQNSTGVGGDMHSATTRVGYMVGMWAMGPEPIEFEQPLNKREAPRAREAVMRNFERIGMQIMNRASADVGQVFSSGPKVQTAARILGQAYFTAYQTMAQNKPAIEYVANTLMERKEMYGDEVVDCLDRAGIQKPDIDYLDPQAWPKI
ncbi:MAG TPA: AAA family ATPase [Thermoleophilaceae bacterium]|nr:AAA family ATPase [Thermoleophilaceae bacterium]